MATLTETAKQIRLTINVFLILAVLFIIFRVTYKIIQLLTTPNTPPVVIIADNAFGPLPNPNFEEVKIKKAITYELDLITGDLPVSSAIVPVFKKIPTTIGLMSPARAKEIAKGYKFDEKQYQEVTPTLYKWNDLNFPRSITVNLITRNYTITYEYLRDPSVFNVKEFSSQTEVQAAAMRILQAGQKVPEDITGKNNTITFMTWKDNSLQIADKKDPANAAEIYLRRDDITITGETGKEYILPVLGETPFKGPIYLLLSNVSDRNKNILELQYNYYTVDITQIGYYYIKTSAIAWEELQSGEGHAVLFDLSPEAEYDTISIRRAYLAYFDQSKKQDYLQPVWTFEGETVMKDRTRIPFAAYVPAITDTMIEKNQPIDENVPSTETQESVPTE